MRTSLASLAVIRRPDREGSPRYLAQWNERWQAFNLVGGHKRETESFRACLVRELFEELGVLPESSDHGGANLPQTGPRCRIAREPLGRLKYEAFSQSVGQRSSYQIELYQVDLSPEANDHVATNPNNRWLSETEIEAGCCTDGKAVSDTMRQHWSWLRRQERRLTPVYWMIAARQRTLEAMSEALASADSEAPFQAECDFVAQRLRQLFPGARALIIRDRLEGFRRKTRPHKLMIEVVPPAQEFDRAIAPAPALWCCREVHLIKIGDAAELEEELCGWQSCSPPGNRDTILTSLHGPRDARGELLGLIYGEANSAIGGPATSLEEAFLDCCRFGTPSPESIGHALRQMFSRLHDRFYRRSFVPAAVLHFAVNPRPPFPIRLAEPDKKGRQVTLLRRRMELALKAFSEADGEPASTQDEERRRLRRETLATLVLGDQPSFLDPIDYVSEAITQPARVPSMLVGASHGDLHGRNVLVSRLENEVGQVAVFDYGDMHLANLVGWDFVKLETELKIRIYPHLFRHTRSSFVREVHAFEKKLCKRTEDFYHNRPEQDDEKETDDRRERLARLLLEIRRQAGRYLGRQRDGLHAWLEEYYFLLVCYGVQAARFPTYGTQELLGAYVAAGTVARQLSYPWRELDEQISCARSEAEKLLPPDDSGAEVGTTSQIVAAAKAAATFGEPDKQIGHHARLAFARVWVQVDRAKLRPFLEAAVSLLDELRQQYPHVLEITEVRLLGQLDLAGHAEAEGELAELSRRNVELSYEILCRLGRLFKDRGERAWPQDHKAMPPAARRDFELALQVYRRAWRQSRNYYPGVNVAALLYLLGEDSEAANIATLVLQVAQLQPGEDHWAVITQGDAHFLLNDHGNAVACYHSVRERCTPQNLRSILRQIHLLLRVEKAVSRTYWDVSRLTDLFGEEAVRDVFGPGTGQ